jgi:hypothetical protein
VSLAAKTLRRAANGTPVRDASGTVVRDAVNVTSWGTDHHLAGGMVILNGSVPPRSRLGAIADLYTPAASKDLSGMPDGDAAAYPSTQVVGSLLKRCFPDMVPHVRAVRPFWADFSAPIDLVLR